MNSVPARPDREFRVGAVRVAVWINPRQMSNGRSFDSHKVILERTYKDMHGDFKTTQSLELNDIPKAIIALKKVYEFCLVRRSDTEASAAPGHTPQMAPNRIP